MSKLYVVPTPIGNLRDITLRAVDILKNVDLILAEDTRKTGFLLSKLEIKKPVRSHHKFNEHRTLSEIRNMLISGSSVALVSDAGTPGISDPGYLLIRECIAHNIQIECLPGATAFIPALVASGLPTDRFCFEGFLPQKKGRSRKLEDLKKENRTMIFFESPFRLVKTLQQFADVFGKERRCSVSRELTKLYEETRRGSIEEMINYYTEKPVKGEIIIILAGN
jgi:16S rRNA (cytidine1402-2'-O)-methyltransferase